MNTVHSEFESTLKLDEIYFTHIEFSRTENLAINELKLQINKEICYTDVNSVKITLSAQIFAEDNSITVSVVMVGLFHVIQSDLPEDIKKQMVETNTIAIMFPYLRSQISLITTQPGMLPIIIPTININALVQENKE